MDLDHIIIFERIQTNDTGKHGAGADGHGLPEYHQTVDAFGANGAEQFATQHNAGGSGPAAKGWASLNRHHHVQAQVFAPESVVVAADAAAGIVTADAVDHDGAKAGDGARAKGDGPAPKLAMLPLLLPPQAIKPVADKRDWQSLWPEL